MVDEGQDARGKSTACVITDVAFMRPVVFDIRRLWGASHGYGIVLLGMSGERPNALLQHAVLANTAILVRF